MEGPKSITTQDFTELTQFLNSNLRPTNTWSITDEYPLAFTPQNIDNLKVIKSENKIVAHACVKTLLVRSPGGLFKVAAIGSVVTAEEFRNLGLSKKILEDVLKTSAEQGHDFAILWTDLFDFYRKLDFELAGSELSVVINESFAPTKDSSWKFMHTNKISPEAIARVYSQHTVGVLRTSEDVRKHLSIPNSNVYSMWDSNNQLLAFAVEGKGLDLGGYIHEWGGKVPALLALFAEIRKARQQDITVIFPSHAKNLARNFEGHGLQPHEGYLGMIKPLDKRNLFFKVLRQARFAGVSDFVIYESNGEYFFGLKDKIYKTSSIHDVTKLIFGPFPPEELYDFDSETSEALKKFLPIPMWIWGWDSI